MVVYVRIEDILKKYLKRYNMAGTLYHIIVVPVLSENLDNTLILEDNTTEYDFYNGPYIYEIEKKNIKFVIKDKFDDEYDTEEKIKHSFHKDSINVYSYEGVLVGTTPIYYRGSGRGFSCK